MLKRCIFVAAIICMPVLAQAFDCMNWYLRGFGGLNFLSVPSTSQMSLETDVGCAFGGAIGYKFSRTFRMEGEVTYRHNGLDYLLIKSDSGDVQVSLDGSVASLAYMGNILFDFPVGWTFVPYFGAGLGGSREWGEISVTALEGTPDELKFKLKGEGAVYQLIAGLHIVRCISIDVGLEYRFFDSITDLDSASNHSLLISCCKTF